MSNHKGKTLKSYSIKRKLEIVSEMDRPLENGSMPSLNSISMKYGIDRKCLREWRKKRDAGAFEEVKADASKKIHDVRRLSGGGLKSPYADTIDQKLYTWVKQQNQKGLVVKDKYLTYKALSIAVELDIEGFTASKGYISRFKKRNNLVSRAHTSTRSLPDNAKEIAVEFINKINNLIRQHNIQKRNILNFDQVPRYFEMESSYIGC
jgi:Tc5 transposase DNA-binding domain